FKRIFVALGMEEDKSSLILDIYYKRIYYFLMNNPDQPMPKPSPKATLSNPGRGVETNPGIARTWTSKDGVVETPGPDRADQTKANVWEKIKKGPGGMRGILAALSGRDMHPQPPGPVARIWTGKDPNTHGMWTAENGSAVASTPLNVNEAQPDTQEVSTDHSLDENGPTQAPALEFSEDNSTE